MQSPFPYFNGFTYSDAILYEEGVTRRDPTPVIFADGLYHVWYSRTTTSCDGYSASVWYAASRDGHVWEERGEAVPKGPAGAFDEHSVFTPTILIAANQYFLFYTAVPEPFTNDRGGPRGTRTAIGVASADSPQGPWQRYAGNPVLRPSDDPEQFDSMRVDDTCIVVRHNQFWMYYKGRQMEHSWGETKMGLAVADVPCGPFHKSAANPVMDSGHEVCVWPHGDGVGCLVSDTGRQGNTLQYSNDGLNFQKIANATPPKAPAPFRQDAFQNAQSAGITWGLSIVIHPHWPYLVRFDCDLRCPP